jgi:hypothetical protein
MTVDPGHFHAALVQKEMYPGVDPRVDVYAPLGADLYEHLKRIDAFNRRPASPTAWTVVVHASSDAFERMLRDRPGNVVVFSGRNGAKIDRIAESVKAGLNVLADKPWILKSADLDKLEGTLAEADRAGVVAYDIMTERFEVTSILQRALVNDSAVFGEMLKGTVDDPAVYMESVHYLLKLVAGAPNIRPAWFFDNTQQGEGRCFPNRRLTIAARSRCSRRSAGPPQSTRPGSHASPASVHFPLPSCPPSRADASTTSATPSCRTRSAACIRSST